MIEIVRAEERHVPDIGKLWLEYMHFHQDIDPIFTTVDDAVPIFEENHLLPVMKSEDSLVLVALDEGRVVGYSFSEIRQTSKVLKRNRHGYVHDMAVTASYRRRGIGEKMFDELLNWFYSKNIDRVELDITTKNQVASSFWKKHGFTNYTRRLYRQI